MPETPVKPSTLAAPQPNAKRRKSRIAFVGWNPAQFLHFAPIAARFPHAAYLIEVRAEAKAFDFDHLPGAPRRILKLTPEAMRALDGKFKVIVCQSPFAGMETLHRTRIAMLQVGYAKESWNFAPWRSLADLCLTFGRQATRKLEPFAPCVTIGNPRFADWGKPEFHQAAVAKYAPKLDPRRKTLLYTPTWGADSSLESYAPAMAALRSDYNVICHLHPRSELGDAAAIARLRGSFTLVCGSRDDIAELLAVSDLLLADSSGAIFDAVFCRKPVILLDVARSGNQGDESGPEHVRRSELGRQVVIPAALAPAVAEVLVSPESGIKHLEALRGDLFADPEGAAKAARLALIRLAKKSYPSTRLQQTLRTAMRTTYRCQYQLGKALTWTGFLRHQMVRARAMLGKNTPLLQPADPRPAVAPLRAKARISSAGKNTAEGRVVHIRFDTPADEILEQLQPAAGGESTGFVDVDHGPVADPDMHLLKMAQSNLQARDCIMTLARAGYFTHKASDGCTRAVHAERIKYLGDKIAGGGYQISADQLIHTLTPPLHGRATKRLLVMFSAARITDPGLKRFFTQDFLTIQKYIAPETAVLRIADIGGVIGAFYLDTVHRPDNARAVQNLIHAQRERLGIDHDAVVLFGVSKGGTGALYHGLCGGFRFISVDPIVSTDFYRQQNKWHYTDSVFPERIEQTFARLFGEIEMDGRADTIAGRSALICSDRSEQFPYISSALFERFAGQMTIFNSQNPLILSHGEVAGQTLNTSTMLFNMQLYGLKLPADLHCID